MSALAALTASVPPCEAFAAGVRWGIGHSTGLLLVTAVFLGIGEQHMDLDRVGCVLSSFMQACLLAPFAPLASLCDGK